MSNNYIENLYNQGYKKKIYTSNQIQNMSQLVNLTKKQTNENLNLLLNLNPSKLNYSIEEVATLANVSYDFIRTRILSNKIEYIKFGSTYQINVHEVARILKEGI